MKPLFILITLLSTTFLTIAQPVNKARLDSFFDIIEKHHRAMGSVAIAEDGKITYQRSFGFAYAKDADTITNSKETLYRIGSVTKMFTATLILHLAGEGLLSLDDTLSNFYAGVANADEITIRQLLNHRSGIHNFTNDDNYPDYLAKAKSKQELLSIIKNAGSDFKPGSKQEYSNSNYVLLGLIAEDITEKSYAELLRVIITQPLGLKNTRVGAEILPQKNMAYSYLPAKPWQAATETNMSIPRGAGAIISTPPDMLMFIHALRNGKIISQEMADSMLPHPEQQFGMGTFAFPFYDRIAYGHTGGIDGFRSNLAHFDQEELGLAICLNAEKTSLNEIAKAMLSIYFNEDYELPDYTTVKVEKETLKKYVGLYQNAEFPLDIKIYIEGESLFAQATGQQSFPLRALSPTEFIFSPANIKMIFDAKKQQMHFSQGGLKKIFEKARQ